MYRHSPLPFIVLDTIPKSHPGASVKVKFNVKWMVTVKLVKWIHWPLRKDVRHYVRQDNRLLLYFTDSKVSKAEAMKKTPVVKKNKRTPGIVYYIFPLIMCKVRLIWHISNVFLFRVLLLNVGKIVSQVKFKFDIFFIFMLQMIRFNYMYGTWNFVLNNTSFYFIERITCSCTLAWMFLESFTRLERHN